jgi:formylglycine-generating enzyme required for sulfatase activity
VGSTTEGWDDGLVAPARVGSLTPNSFGLHDVHGNVWEYCQDVYGAYLLSSDESGGRAADRVERGGGYGDLAVNARTAVRYAATPTNAHENIGLRPASRL